VKLVIICGKGWREINDVLCLIEMLILTVGFNI